QGLHRFVDPADGKVYLYTHFEAADSRRMYSVFEQPDLKAHVDFDVIAPSDWRVASNQVHEDIREEEDGLLHDFALTPRMSTYLTAIAAGPYVRFQDEWHSRDGSESIPLGILARASLAEYVDHEEIFKITKQGLAFYHRTFGYPYPWGKYDQIFVPEYNLGAMENPGLVTFTENYIHRGPATRSELAGRTNTILHEMAHMWFGDLVTPKWWDDLWLKESF
ncbi:aminopeptidase N, partial [Cutibacterium acnes subsp. acnes]|nr:aminopeptidase N [Cutibacterium acnes subsp. acnes]